MISDRKNLLINLVASSSVFIIQLVVNFWLSPFIISRLGESSYGFISLCNNFAEYAALLSISVNSMASRYMSVEYNCGNIEKAKSIFSSVFWINVFFSVIILISSSIVVFYLDKFLAIESHLICDVKLAMEITFINLIISMISTCYIAVPFVTNQMTYNSFTQILSKIIGSVFIIMLFTNFSPHIYYVSLSTICASFIGLIIYLQIKRHLLPEFNISWHYFDISQICAIAKSGVWMLVSNLNSIMLVGLDLLIANVIIDSSSMGRLSVSKLLPTLIGRILGSFSNVFTADFTKTYALKKSNLCNEVTFSLRLLGVVFGVPFAGIIVFGQSFFELWLPHDVYNSTDILQIYILTILALINVIINAFMYSIHSLFITLNKIKWYSLVILGCSIVSFIATILLASQTSLGVYAIAGTSTVVLGFVNLIVFPMYAEKASSVKHFTFFKSIVQNHIALIALIAIYILIKPFLNLSTLLSFCISVIILGLIGYIITFMILLKPNERYRLYQLILTRIKRIV